MIRASRIVIAVAFLTCFFEPSNAVSECISNPSGLISFWSGDRDARDVLGGNDGILVNGAEAGVPGQVGGAFSLDGVDDSVDIANNPVFDVTNALTLEAWIKLSTLKDDQKIFSHITSYEMGVYNEKLELILKESAAHRQAQGGTVLQTDTWYHVVTTWDGVRITSYVNGEFDRSVAFNDPLDAGINNFSIGSESGGRINFAGHIDEAAFYIRALTAEEVQEHYQRGLLHQGFCLFSDSFENAPTALCGSCVTENECLGPTDQCLELDGGSYCSQDCSAGNPHGTPSNQCPPGYSCTNVMNTFWQCVPVSRSCTCGPSNGGDTRICSISNVHGTCEGVETCNAGEGWVGCDAVEPSPDGCI